MRQMSTAKKATLVAKLLLISLAVIIAILSLSFDQVYGTISEPMSLPTDNGSAISDDSQELSGLEDGRTAFENGRTDLSTLWSC